MAAIQDLRAFLEVLEQNGQLLHPDELGIELEVVLTDHMKRRMGSTSLRKFSSSQTSELLGARSPN